MEKYKNEKHRHTMIRTSIETSPSSLASCSLPSAVVGRLLSSAISESASEALLSLLLTISFFLLLRAVPSRAIFVEMVEKEWWMICGGVVVAKNWVSGC